MDGAGGGSGEIRCTGICMYLLAQCFAQAGVQSTQLGLQLGDLHEVVAWAALVGPWST
jgi:hypothetical protein